MQMEYKNDNSKKAPFGGLFGEMTAAKASGVSFSLAAILPALLSLVFFVIISALGLTKTENFESADWYLYAIYILPQLSFALSALFYFRARQGSVKSIIQKQKCAPKYFLIAILLQIGLFSLSELNALFLEFLSRFGYQDGGIPLPSMDGFGFVGALFAIAVLPAVFEEILFRGVLLDGLKCFSKAGAVVLCGALFSLYHQNPAQTAYQFCCGAAFALVAIRSGSVLPTVLAHFFNNALILALTKFGVTGLTLPTLVALLAVSAFCLVISLSYLIFVDKQPKEEQENAERKSERKIFWIAAAAGVAVCALSWLATFFGGI